VTQPSSFHIAHTNEEILIQNQETTEEVTVMTENSRIDWDDKEAIKQ